VIIPLPVLRMRNVQIKVVEKIKTHIFFAITFFLNPAVYEKMCKNFAVSDRPQVCNTAIRIACWLPKATNTISE